MPENTKTTPFRSKPEIEDIATAVLRHHGLYGVPVDPILVAHAANIKVSNAHFSEPNVSGMIAKRGENEMILVNASDPPSRKRFSIAHELGHHFLHLSEDDGEFVTSALDLFRESDPENSDADARSEWQANYFAAALLMPSALVRQWHDVEPDAATLAQRFNVSRQAMEYRLRQLDLA